MKSRIQWPLAATLVAALGGGCEGEFDVPAPPLAPEDVSSDAPHAVETQFDGAGFRVRLSRALGASELALDRVQLLAIDGTASPANVAGDVTLEEAGRVLRIELASAPVLGRSYRVIAALAAHDGAPFELTTARALPQRLLTAEADAGKLAPSPLAPGEAAPSSVGMTTQASFNVTIDWAGLARALATNTDSFYIDRITPSEDEIVRRADRFDAAGNLTHGWHRSITVHFGGTDTLDCSSARLPIRRASTEDPTKDRDVFRLWTARDGAAWHKHQMMFVNGRGVVDPIPNRGSLRCDARRRTMTFSFPGRLASGTDLQVYATARSVEGRYAEREFKLRIEPPRINVELTKIRNERGRPCEGRSQTYSRWRRCDVYVATVSNEDPDRPLKQFGPFGNMDRREEARPESTFLYEGPVRNGLRIPLVAADHDDLSWAVWTARAWQVSSAIFCYAYSYCPNELPALTAPAHEALQNHLAANGDDILGSGELEFREGSLQLDDTIYEPWRNWGLDPISNYWVDPDGYRININKRNRDGSFAGHDVTVWIKVKEVPAAWHGPYVRAPI